MTRDNWTSRIGIILAVAGSAVGLGNFLRFPVQAAQNGGGAFMIPYLTALLLLGIPLCWVEWTMGRSAGARGHGSGPGILNVFWNHRLSRYLGCLGIFIPLVIYAYYVYIESWCLGYAFFSLTGSLGDAAHAGDMKSFLSGYQGLSGNKWFSGIGIAYIFFLATFAANFYFIYKGVTKGIEALNNIALPILIILGVIIMARVLFLGTPDPARPDQNVINGMGFMWNPDFSKLADAKVWLAAAGQIFFSLSVGLGTIITYASYLRKDDDVALSGITAVSMNEFVEVIIGGSVAITAAFIFFGATGAQEIAHGGSFNLGFVTMPMVFDKMPLSTLFSFIWFFLLFLAGVTSSISMLQPGIAFLEDEFGFSRHKSVTVLGAVTFLMAQPAILFIDKGVLDLMDFWGGTFSVVLFATVEALIFGWVFGVGRGFEELHRGADIRVPSFFRFVIKYVTPSYLIAILGYWMYQDGLDNLLLRKVSPESFPYALATMIGMGVFMVALVVATEYAFSGKRQAAKRAGGMK